MTQPYPMQMKHRELARQEAFEILEEGEFATISTVDPDGTPYGVPVSYVMMDEKLYIHTGKRPGHKIDDFTHDSRVCVSVASELEPIYEDTFFTTRFASAIATGRISLVEDRVTVKQVLAKLCMKYCPQFKKEIGGAIERELDATDIWVVEFDEVRGKAGRRLKRRS